MKIIHCADLHLDSRLAGLPHNKAIARRLELTEAFRSLATQAADNGVDAVVIAGDLFDNHFVSARTKDDVADIFASVPELRFFVLAGNHDASAFDDVYLKRLSKNVSVFGREGVTRFDFGNVSFFGVEGEKLSPALLESFAPDENRFNVLVTHADLSSKSVYGGLDLRLLKDKPVDYVALGHIHRPFLTTAGRGHAAYSGCLECRGFDEPGEHGFYLLKTHLPANDDNRIVFMPFTSRVCFEVTLDVTGLESRAALVAAAQTALDGVRPEDMVSLTLTGETEEGCDPETPISHYLNSAFFATRLKNSTKLKLDAEKYANDVSLKAEFLRKLAASGFDDQTRSRLARYGLNALAGEEIDTL